MPTITIEKTGSTSRPLPSPLGSGPASHPMSGELNVTPLNPHVIMNPMAVAVPCLKVFPTTAMVVGNSGAIARPTQNTATAAVVESVALSIAKVVTAMAMAEPSVTVSGGILINTGAMATRPSNNPSAKPRERMVRAVDSAMPCVIR